MTTGTTSFHGASIDDASGTLTNFNLGSGATFEFWFMGVRYTQFSAGSNGMIQLGTAISTTAYNLPQSTNPVISPFSADLKTGTDGAIKAKVVGTAPNRCLVVEYSNMMLHYGSTNALGTGTFQARFYETSGVIEFVYGAMARNANTPGTSTVTIGFSSNTTANNVVTVNTGSHTASTSATITTNTYAVNAAIANLTSASNGSRRYYRFTPPIPNAPTVPVFTNLASTTYSLGWTDNASNERGYVLYYSTDNITYSFVSQFAANTVLSNITSLTANTLYYWRVYAVSEGGLSSALSTSQRTCTAAPASLTGSATGATTASISFATVTGATSYELQYRVNGGSTWTTASPAPTSSPYVLSGLSASTTYDIQLRGPNAVCGTFLTTTAAFTTQCAAVSSLPWTEGFEGMSTFGAGVLPSCWATSLTTGTNATSASSAIRNSIGACGGSKYFWTKWSSDTWIFTPYVSLTEGVSYEFSFDQVATDAVAGFTLTIGAGLSQTSAGMTTTLGTIVDPINTSCSNRKYTFTAPTSGNYCFGIRSNCPGSSPWYLGFDNFKVDQIIPAFSNISNVSCEKIAFNNLRDSNRNPSFSIVGSSGTSNAVQVELNTKSDFTGTAYTQTFTGTFTGKYNLTSTSINLPTTNNIIYYARVRDSKNGGGTYSGWSAQTWAYVYSTSTPGYHITTKPQFDGGTNVSTTYGNYLSSTGTGIASDYMSLGVGSFSPTSATTDAVYENGTYYPSISYMTIGWQNNCNGNAAIYDGYPFTLNIPQGATINSADFSVVGTTTCVCEDQAVSMRLIADAHLADNAPTLSSSNLTNTSSPTRTTANQTFLHTGTWTSGTRYTLSSVTNIVQEIVNRSGFAAGNTMNLLLRWNTSYSAGTNNNRCLYQADNGTSTAPKISGEFTNFSNSRKFTNIQLASFGSSCAKWDKLLTNETVSGCGSCSVNYKVFVAGSATLIAQGTGSVDLGGTAYATTSAVDIEVIAKRDNGTPQINDFTLTTTSSATASLAATSKTPTTTCEDLSGGWTYYLDPSDATKQIIGIQWGNNNATSKCNTSLTLNVKTTGTTAYDVAANTTTKKAAFTMGRYWNVTTTPSTLNSSVSVRFFYNPADTVAMRTAANAWAAANPTPISGYTTKAGYLEWFKTIGINFRPDSMKANGTHGGSSSYYKPTPLYGSLNGVSYVQYDGVASFSGGTAGIQVYPVPNANSPVSLPVELIYLTATPVDNRFIRLDWATAAEINNKGFEVERSDDGENFTKIGWVDGNGNSSQTITYKLDDKDVIPNKVYYYRLKQIDNDGQYEYTYIVSAKLIAEKGFVFEDMRPNPANNKVVLNILTATAQEVKVNVLDVLGQIVLKQNWQLSEGLNGTELDLQNLAGGTYTVTVISEGSYTSKKLVIAR